MGEMEEAMRFQYLELKATLERRETSYSKRNLYGILAHHEEGQYEVVCEQMREVLVP